MLFENELDKAGLPVGTIHGNYKKISDNPSEWEFVTQERAFKELSGNERRAWLANKAQLITDTMELSCTTKNYKSLGTWYLAKMQNEVFTRDVVCHLNNKRIVDVDQKHIFKDKNTEENKALRVRALPFVLPIIEKYGKRGLKTERTEGTYQEIVGKADITVKNGTKKRCAIAVILFTDKKDRQHLKQLSVFVVDNKVIKSLATANAHPHKSITGQGRQIELSCASDSHSTTYNPILPRNNRTVNKSLSIFITDITEGNRTAKYEQLEKALTGQKSEKIPADNTPRLPLLNINLKDYSLERVNKALRAASLSLGVPTKSAKGEAFTFKAQEELTDKWVKFFSELVNNTYNFIIDYFDLPKITVMSKSQNLTWKGKVLYSPESGEPITKKEWDFFVKNLEKFLNCNISNAAEKIVLDSKALGHILDRMLKTNTLEAIKKQNLSDLKINGKSFDWISDSVKNMKNALGESLTRKEQARIEVIQQSAAEKITRISDTMKSEVKQVLIDGVVDRKSKSQVSQALFDKMVGHNRDFQRIADTEIQKTFNNSFIREEVHNAKEGEKVYFERVEVIDGNTCPYCQKINGKIAIWSETPLASGAVKDEYADLAIWEGKEWNGKKLEKISDAPISVVHPFCRGTWIRCYPELDGIKKKSK